MVAHLTSLAVRESLSTARHPQHASELAREGVDDLTALSRVTFLPVEAKTSLKGHLGVRKVVAWSELIPLDSVKGIAATVHGTVNDVLVSAVAGGLRRYLVERGDDVPASLELHATVPVNLRRLDGPIELGNRFGLVYPALPVGIADPLQRLRAVKANIDKIKGTPEAVVAITVLDALGHAPRAVEEAFIDFFTSKSSMVLTNVPGPRHHRRFAGARLQRVLSWAPPSGNLAMSVSIFSYAGQVTVALQTDAATIPDPQAIVDAIHVELEQLGRAGARRERARRARAARR
jgi:WS/DGAT/MGAT family acyltransferase